MLAQVEQKDLRDFKIRFYEVNEGICPILGKWIPLDKMVVDHQHKLKSEEPDESGKGCIRGIIDNRANQLEGKINNIYKRFGLEKDILLPDLLRNLANYYEHNLLHTEEIKYIHPREKPKEPKLQKSRYNRLKKAYNLSDKKAKFPEYPKSGKITKKLQELLLEFNL